MSNSSKKKKLALIRDAIGVPQEEKAPKRSVRDRMLDLELDIISALNAKREK